MPRDDLKGYQVCGSHLKVLFMPVLCHIHAIPAICIGSSPTIQNRRKQACSICHVTALEIFEDGYHISSVSSFPALNSEHHAGPMASSSVGFIRRHQTLNTYSPTLLQRK
ncbi:Hypothetical predicted protein [Podarcis lilfordi]|uniref:Uncharacterized protein n=1 Tax=Podarcis lilfordi TaxID=74358 RepID=A0AA35NWL8_9SAUR|nr:Hypothetical predicted protein [Podarcis lilfordi]